MKAATRPTFDDRSEFGTVPEPTDDMVRSVACPVCRACAGDSCQAEHIISTTCLPSFHQGRYEAAKAKLMRLNATDKALILYYAFTMISDSVAVNSAALFGKKMESAEVQRFFGKQAVEALKKDGLLR